MNNKIVSRKKASAIFLAIVLAAGIIALSSPSFMVGGAAQAEPYYSSTMDNNYKKSSGKDVTVKSIKCNNINVNVNGLELNLTSIPFLSNLLASEADEDGEKVTGSYGSYGSSGSYSDGRQQSGSDKDFKFICINNNNNTVVGVVDDDDGVTLPPGPTPEEECEECFAQVLNGTELAILEEALEEGIEIFTGPTETVEVFSLLELCNILETLSGSLIVTNVFDIIAGADLDPFVTPEEFFELVTCIGTALGITIPPF